MVDLNDVSLITGGMLKQDIGTGFGSESSAATSFSAFASQLLRLGRGGAGNELYGVLLDLVIARGLYTLQQMLAIP